MTDVIRELRKKMQAEEQRRQDRLRFWKLPAVAAMLMIIARVFGRCPEATDIVHAFPKVVSFAPE